MTSVFLKAVNVSISAGWLVLAALAFRLVFRRAPRWVHVLLWGVVALRLLLPVSIESPVSLVPSAETIRPETVQFAEPAIESGVPAIDRAVNPVLETHFPANPAGSVNPLFVWTEAAGVVWLLGAAAMLSYAGFSFFRLRRRVGASLRTEGNVYLCDGIDTPFILGVLRPRIYLPSAMEEGQRACVLAHERAHLNRRDHWWKPLGYVLLAVYWFNPLLWLAYVLLCRDIELACDERVIRGLRAEEVQTYSAVLLACSTQRRRIAACPLAFGEVGVKARVKRALRYKKPAFWVVAASLAVCLAASVCFLTDPERNETLRWAQTLRAEDVVSVELTVMPQAPERQYRTFSAEEIPEAVALLNESRGRRAAHPEELAGGSITLYVTTADGVRHTVSNEGNTYLRIDGDTYKPGYDWLSAWPYTQGNTALPEGVSMEDGRFHTEKWSIRIIGQWDLLGWGYSWMSYNGTNAELILERVEDLEGMIRSVEEYGDTVEKLDGYYHYFHTAYTDGTYHSETYLYPVLDSTDGYSLDIGWTNKEPWEPGGAQLALEQKQLKLMAESFRMTADVNRLDVLPLTGYAAYDTLIARGREAIETYNLRSEDFSYELVRSDAPGWALRDLDGDGTPELLFCADWGDGYTPIFNLYTLEDGEAVQLLYGWNRNRYWLCPDGTIGNHGSSSSGESGNSWYRYEDGAVHHVETVYHYGFVAEGVSPWWYSDSSDDFWAEQPDGSYDTSPAFRRISEAEAERISAGHGGDVTLDYTPFAGSNEA